jgi:gamma-glutamylcyclotransferase (GGCT)/AIG2-like uncharacterized protein YtfP
MQQLFVYGSLRSGFNHPAYAYMADNFLLLGKAKVNGKLYDMGEYPAALPSGEDMFIYGELYQLREDRDFDWVIAQVDAYEGLDAEPGETPLYRRDKTKVYINETTTTAWIYWYNKEVYDSPVIASGDILDYLRLKK